MKTFTVFCQEVDGRGTVWISAVEAETPEDAMDFGQHQCAEDWGMNERDVHVLGVAEGDVKILHWNDIDE